MKSISDPSRPAPALKNAESQIRNEFAEPNLNQTRSTSHKNHIRGPSTSMLVQSRRSSETFREVEAYAWYQFLRYQVLACRVRPIVNVEMKVDKNCAEGAAWQEVELGEEMTLFAHAEKIPAETGIIMLAQWRFGRSVGIDLKTVHDVGPGFDLDLCRDSYLAAAEWNLYLQSTAGHSSDSVGVDCELGRSAGYLVAVPFGVARWK